MPLSLTDRIQQGANQLATEVDGEVMLLSVENSRYYGLDDIGSEIWRRIESPVTIQALCDGLTQAYAADPAIIQRDVLALLAKLEDQELIRVLA